MNNWNLFLDLSSWNCSTWPLITPGTEVMSLCCQVSGLQHTEQCAASSEVSVMLTMSKLSENIEMWSLVSTEDTQHQQEVSTEVES